MFRDKEPLRLPRLPHPRRPEVERRKHRPTGAADALRSALDHAADRGQVDVIVITDDRGMVVANSGTDLELDMLAAVTPIVARGHVRAKVKKSGEQRGLSVRTVRIFDELLHVAALGGESTIRERELIKSAAAARRILAA